MRGFLLDENMSDALAQAIHSLDPRIRVRQVGKSIAPPLGSPDPDLLLWIEERDFVLVTNNRKSMPVHLTEHLAAGRHVPGILQVPKEYEFGELAEALQVLYGASLEDEYLDRIVHLSALMATDKRRPRR